MRNVAAIFQKQIKDTFKNKEILIQFVMFPVLALIMEELIHVEGLPRNYFVNMFSSMFVGMAPLVSIAAVISEEKEKNTLRVLMMSGVKPAEYLLGIGSYIWLACMAGAFIMGMTGKYKGREFAVFLMVMGVGILASMLIMHGKPVVERIIPGAGKYLGSLANQRSVFIAHIPEACVPFSIIYFCLRILTANLHIRHAENCRNQKYA